MQSNPLSFLSDTVVRNNAPSLTFSGISTPPIKKAENPWDKLPLEDATFTVIDLETTGLNPVENAITEITAIQFKNGTEIGKYTTLVKPTEPISPRIEQFTGITNEMVSQAPSLEQALRGLSGFIGNVPLLVGHNVAFDIEFLREKTKETGLAKLTDRYDLNRAFCTFRLAKKALPDLQNHKGMTVAKAYGVNNPCPHRAEADVRMSAGILFEFLKRQKEQDPTLKSVQDLFSWQGPLRKYRFIPRPLP